MASRQIALLLALFLGAGLALPAEAALKITYSPQGLETLTYNGVKLVDTIANPSDSFNIKEIWHITPGGTTNTEYGSSSYLTRWMDLNTKDMTYNFSWGIIRCGHQQVGDRLNITISITNSDSVNTLAGANIFPFAVRFPVQPTNWDPTVPQVGFNIKGPTINYADYGSGMLVECNDETTTELYNGLFSTGGTATNHLYLLWASSIPFTGQPGFWPILSRPIPPRGSDTYTFSLRFAPSGTPLTNIVSDVLQKYSKSYPYELIWPDRRSIGTLHLASPAMGWPKNPRGWFEDANLDITTPSGVSNFHSRVLSYADSSILIMKGMDSQGGIVWDLEGEEYPHATSYIGDPRILAQLCPEMDSIADAFFQKFRDAGLKIGCCVRPQQLVVTSTNAYQDWSADFEQELFSKVDYAKTRWGLTMFYLDSNGSTDSALDARIIRRLWERYPDTLFVPEHENTLYYSASAPFGEIDMGDMEVYPELTLMQYPQAFWCLYIPPDKQPNMDVNALVPQLVQCVRRGDILLSRGWFNDTNWNPLIMSVYQQAGDYIPPTVYMTCPTNLQVFSGITNLTAFAWDNTGTPAGVQFKLDGMNCGTEDTTYPYGVSLNTVMLSRGLHTAAAVARDSAALTSNSVSVTFIVTTGTCPVVISPTSATGNVDVAFSYQIVACCSPTNYSAVGLPAGLGVNPANGLISGTPTQIGTNSVTLSALGIGGVGTTHVMLLVVTAPTPVITSPTTAAGTLEQPFTYQITATNYQSSYGAAGLPPWLTVNTTNGLISGTPIQIGTNIVTLYATGPGGTGSTNLILAITTFYTGTVYYVSPTGNDANSGTSSASPWQTLAKVNSTSFAPGDTILFQRGGEWRESLSPTEGGNATQPITFDAYGTGNKPKFWGSVILTNANFSSGGGGTYTYNIPGLTGSQIYVLQNHQFLGTGPATYSSPTLTITSATDPRTDGKSYTVCVRGNVIYNNLRHYLVFRNLVADETAGQIDGVVDGYGIRLYNATNLVVEDCEAYHCGRANIGVVNVDGFIGRRITCGYAAPAVQNGANLFLSATDYSTPALIPPGNHEWINCVSSNADNGAGGTYNAFYCGGPSPGMGTVTLRGFNANSRIQSASSIVIRDGLISSNGSIEIWSSGSIVDGVMFHDMSTIQHHGNGATIQNCVFDPTPTSTGPGGGAWVFLWNGVSNNVLRFNTFVAKSYGCVILDEKATHSQIYGNIMNNSTQPFALWAGSGGITTSDLAYCDYNFYDSSPSFMIQWTNTENFAKWKAHGFDTHSLTGTPQFVGAGSYRLKQVSTAIDAANVGGARTPPWDFDVTARPLDGNGDGTAVPDMGAYEYASATVDTDHDGMNDAAEVAAGTNPTNATEHLEIAQLLRTATDASAFYFTWLSLTGVNYKIQTTTNLFSGWTNVADPLYTNIPGIGFPLYYPSDITSGGKCRFYRIRASLQ